MKALLSRMQESKTRADQSRKVLQMRAAEAFKTGNFAEMLRLDAKAEQSRISDHNQFFETGLKTVLAAR